MEQKKKPECHFSDMRFIKKPPQGLKGTDKYSQAFLEELDIAKVKHTDNCIEALVNFCKERKITYKLTLVDKAGNKLKTIY